MFKNLIQTSPFYLSADAAEGAEGAAKSDSATEGKIGDTEGVAAKADPEVGEAEAKPLFGMPSDDALFELEDEEPAAKPPAKAAEKPAAPAQEPEPKKVEEKAAAKPAAEPKPVEGAAQEPAKVEPAVTEVKPAPSADDTPAHQSYLEVLDKNATILQDQLSALYKIEEKDLENFAVEPAPALAKLAGKLHFNVIRAATALMMQQIPQLVMQTQQYSKAREEAEGAFWAANPNLDRATDKQLAEQYGQLYWQTNPKGTLEDFNKKVGLMVAAQTGKLQVQTTTTPPTAKPKANGSGPTFTPAAASAPRGARPKADPDDVWGRASDAMVEDLE